MNVAGLQKLTTTDFPGTLACIVFTQGCNLKCPYCHNSELIPMLRVLEGDSITEDVFFDFLTKRKNVLEGVVVTGGEPLVQKDVVEFISKIKEKGYKVKLDTNGTNPQLLKEIIDNKLVDYIAMDIKNDFERYEKTTGVQGINLENIKKSIELLKDSKIDYEFRTTIVKEFHNVDAIANICEMIGKSSNYFLQNFEDSSNVMNHSLHGFSSTELQEFQRYFETRYPKFHVRGIE